MTLQGSLSRRTFLKGAAATAGAGGAIMAGLGPAIPRVLGAGNGRLIPAGKVGTITFTQRDVPGRRGVAASAALGLTPTMGRMGGPNFPQDPTDLGDVVPLPGGWKELFAVFASAGIKQVEFAGYGQHADNPGGTAGYVATPEGRANYVAYAHRLRGLLDEYDLQAIGNHGFIPNTWFGPGSAGGTMSQADYDRFQTELEFASILGMPYMGTGSDPANAGNRNIEPWTTATEKWAALNELSLAWGIHLYPHNHSPAYNFLQDGPLVWQTVDRVTGAPLATPVQIRGESGIRLMEYFIANTDPEVQLIELDIYWAHVAQHQHRWYFDWNGNRVERVFQPLELVRAQPNRFALYHAKDGDRTADLPGVGNGYSIIRFGDPAADIDYRTFFKEQGAKGYHNPNYEQDNAPGGNADPGKSIRDTKFSAWKMNALRG